MLQTAAICYLCGQGITGPAVPRTLEDGTGPVLIHAACWESCASCSAPLRVFEPLGDGAAMPLMFRDRGKHLRGTIRGVEVNLCEVCGDL